MKIDNPIITIDGSAGVGKGTLAKGLANTLNWQILDSGLLYRIVALFGWENLKTNVFFPTFKIVDGELQVVFNDEAIPLIELRNEEIGKQASILAKNNELRLWLLAIQRSYATPSGLITDGRDMGTVVFPEAQLKFFLTANPEISALRRKKELTEYGFNVKMEEIKNDISLRDCQDRTRNVAPLTVADDAIIIDTSNKNPQEVLFEALSFYNKTVF
ncbi:MAG: (d)CMP kinase [Methylacidiphilales bacterium]|nr:(d)CMP kinase [Candidatus Methylacidiphilales bacterium]